MPGFAGLAARSLQASRPALTRSFRCGQWAQAIGSVRRFSVPGRSLDTPPHVIFNNVLQEVTSAEHCPNEDFAVLRRLVLNPDLHIGPNKLVSATTILRFISRQNPTPELLGYLDGVCDRMESIDDFTIGDIAECALCLTRLTSQTEEVRKFLKVLTVRANAALAKQKGRLDSRHSVYLLRTFGGLNEADGPEVKPWKGAVLQLIERFGMGPIDGHSLSYCATVLQDVSPSGSEEDAQLFGVVSRLVEGCSSSVGGGAVSRAMLCLQRMDIESPAVRKLLEIFTAKLKGRADMNAMAVAQALKSVKHMDQAQPEVRAALAALVGLLRALPPVLDFSDCDILAKCLKGLTFASPESKEFIVAVTEKLKKFPQTAIRKSILNNLPPKSHDEPEEMGALRRALASRPQQVVPRLKLVRSKRDHADWAQDDASEPRAVKPNANISADPAAEASEAEKREPPSRGASTQREAVAPTVSPPGGDEHSGRDKQSRRMNRLAAVEAAASHSELIALLKGENKGRAPIWLTRELMMAISVRLIQLGGEAPTECLLTLIGLLNRQSSEVDEVRHLCSVVADLFKRIPRELSASELCIAVNGLRNMTAHKEVLALVSVFRRCALQVGALDTADLARALQGLQLLDCAHPEVAGLLEALLLGARRAQPRLDATALADCLCDLCDRAPWGHAFIADRVLPDLTEYTRQAKADRDNVNISELSYLLQRLALAGDRVEAALPQCGLPGLRTELHALHRDLEAAQPDSVKNKYVLRRAVKTAFSMLSKVLSHRKDVKTSSDEYLSGYQCEILVRLYDGDSGAKEGDIPSLTVNVELDRVGERRSFLHLRDEYLRRVHNVAVVRCSDAVLASSKLSTILSALKPALLDQLEKDGGGSESDLQAKIALVNRVWENSRRYEKK